MELQPLKTFRVSSNQASLLTHDGRTLLIKRYAGGHQQQRRDCEEQTLRLWAEAGFKVPRPVAIDIPELRGSCYLAIEYLDGVTLQEHLQSVTTAFAEKMELLSRILRDNCRRQTLARQRQEPRLLHPDPNSSNVICLGQDYYFIDFETTVASGDLEEASAIETAKFCRWTARDLGIEHLPELARRVVESYQDQLPILRGIVSRTCGRPFQFVHRWQDRRRKRRQPREVTKYDIADALAAALRPATSHGRR